MTTNEQTRTAATESNENATQALLDFINRYVKKDPTCRPYLAELLDSFVRDIWVRYTSCTGEEEICEAMARTRAAMATGFIDADFIQWISDHDSGDRATAARYQEAAAELRRQDATQELRECVNAIEQQYPSSLPHLAEILEAIDDGVDFLNEPQWSADCQAFLDSVDRPKADKRTGDASRSPLVERLCDCGFHYGFAFSDRKVAHYRVVAAEVRSRWEAQRQ